MVLSVTAPQIDWIKQRPKICILPVIDISGSMRGDKLEYAKASVKKLIEQLAPGDFAGVVLFESRVHTLVAPEEVTPEFKTRLLQEVEKIEARGGTNFSDAISSSLEMVQSLDLPPTFLNRIIVFTDGQPTQGITDKDVVKKILGKQLGNTSVSFFGYGAARSRSWSSGCDQDFLTDLSTIGKGNYAYVQNPDDSLAAFGKELGGLLSTYASDLKLTIEARGDHKITKILTDIPVDDDVVGELTLDLNDILAEETRHIVLECELQEQKSALPREVGLFDVTINFSRTTEDGDKVSEEIKSQAKVQFVKAAKAQKTPDKELDKIVSLHDMIRTQTEAEAMAKSGNFKEAQDYMLQRADVYVSKGFGDIAQVARTTSQLFVDNNSVTSSAGYRRSMQRGVLRGASLSMGDEEATSAVIGLVGSLGNSAQAAYTTSFTSDSAAPAAPTPRSPGK